MVDVCAHFMKVVQYYDDRLQKPRVVHSRVKFNSMFHFNCMPLCVHFGLLPT